MILRTNTAPIGAPGPLKQSNRGRLDLSRGDLAAHLALLLTTLAFFWPMIRPIGAHWYMQAGDFSQQFYPFRAFEAQEWWARRIPLWNPDMFAGHPFLADIQTAVFYPPAMLNAILLGHHGFPYFALEGEVVVHTFLAGVFTYWLARYLTGSRIGALVAGLAFAFGGFITTYPAEQLAMLETAIWLPLIVLWLELAARRPVAWRWLVLAGLTFGVAILAGHPQTVLYIAYATGGYLIWRLWWNRARWWRFLLAAVLYPAVALLVAAIQLLPTLQFLTISTRDQMPYAEAAWGYRLSSLWEIFVPLWHGEKALSVGVVALALALLGAWACRREPLVYWIGAGLFAVPLSTGGSTPLFWLLYHYVPGWNLFRDQERAIYIFSFAAALLAGRGVAELQRRDLKRLLLERWAVASAVAAAIFLALYALGPGLRAPAPLRTNFALDTAVLVGVAVLLLVRARLGQPAAFGIGLGFAALVVVELFAINFGNNLSPVSPDPVPRLARTAAFIRSDISEPFRVRGISEAVFPSDYGSILGLPTIGGNTPFQVKRMRDALASNIDWRIWQILNVKYFISNGGQLAGLKLVFQDGPIKTYFMTDSLPRAWAVRAVEVARDPSQAFQMITAPRYHPGNIVVLNQAPSIGPFTPGKRPDVKITHLDPQRIEIDADADANAMLVLADHYYPGWVAYRDGKLVTTYHANYLAMAYELPPGKHHYVIVYRPRWFYRGAAITVLTLLLALGFLAWPWLRRRGTAS